MRRWMVAVMVILCVGLGAAVVGIRTMEDRQGPEIKFARDKNEYYKDDMEDEELLEGVTAVDDKDGDVSDTLTVESVYPTEDGEEVVIIFVAKDSSNNVTKTEFTMKTGEAEEKSDKDEKADSSEDAEEESAEEPEEETAEETPAPEAAPEETPTADENAAEPEATAAPEETPEAAQETPAPEDAQAAAQSPEELTEKENEAKKVQEDKVAQLNPQDPRIYLKSYYLELPRGTAMADLTSYVDRIEDDADNIYTLFRQIHVEGTVDVNTPGTYELTYSVVDSGNNISNGAVLTVVVE